METLSSRKTLEARIPTEFGTFQLHLYHDAVDKKDHVALVLGDVARQDDIVTRVHSECFTAEVLGSLRCDCAGQLRMAMGQIAEAGAGVLIYLRQEGRGIGLADKLRAYNLQDLGHDTVEANLLLGYKSDERTYHFAAAILAELQVQSIRLLTNNPSKLDALSDLGVMIRSRVPLVAPMHPESTRYLNTKVRRMRHQIDLDLIAGNNGATHHRAAQAPDPVRDVRGRALGFRETHGRPFVTLSYAQSLDGCISSAPGKALSLSGPETLTLAHRLRAAHNAIVVGIGTVLSDDPQLTVRRVSGPNPRPIVLDSRLRIPPECYLMSRRARDLWVAAAEGCDAQRQYAIEAKGATVFSTKPGRDGRVDIERMLRDLGERGIDSVMVEGGVQVIKSFMDTRLVDYAIITVAPRFVGGEMSVRVQSQLLGGPRLQGCKHIRLGEDLVLWGEPLWDGSAG